MADTIDALLGLDIDEEEQTRALADKLRYKERLGDYFSLSSTDEVRDLGKRRALGARRDARQIGTRIYDREKEQTRITERGVSDVRLDQARAEASAKHSLSMRKREKAESFKDPDGNMINLQRGPGGTYRDFEGNAVDLTGLTPYDKYNDRTINLGADKKDTYGNAYYRDSSGKRFFIDDVPWSEEEAYRRGRRLADLKVDTEGEKMSRTEQSKLVTEFMGDAYKSSASNRRIQQQYRSAISLIDQGAGTGSVEERLFTFKDVTKALESLQADIGLERIGPLKLTPVSDVDLANVFKTSIPMGLDSGALKIWLNFKIESFGILAEIQDYTYGVLEANNGRMPTGTQKTEMDDTIRQMMNSGEFGLIMPDLASGEATSSAKTKPGYVTQEEWDSYTPEQRAQL